MSQWSDFGERISEMYDQAYNNATNAKSKLDEQFWCGAMATLTPIKLYVKTMEREENGRT